ncbi:MAG: hypothetical protein AB7O96_14415 [Pseudobdellovibrionaceae bacterium]
MSEYKNAANTHHKNDCIKPRQKPTPTPKRLGISIKADTVNPADFLKYEMRSSCEECTHFNPENGKCTLGYVTKYHRKEQQLADYLLTGKMVFCRFHEID